MGTVQWLPPTLNVLYGGGLHLGTRGTLRVFVESVYQRHSTLRGAATNEVLGVAGGGVRVKNGVLRVGGGYIYVDAGSRSYGTPAAMAGIGLLMGKYVFGTIDGFAIPNGGFVQVSLGLGVGVL